MQCKSKCATEHYVSTMLWTAMPHLDSLGARGQASMTPFDVSTIPAVVLLDGNGAVVCLDGRRKITEDPTDVGFPSSLFKAIRLPSDPCLEPWRARKPSSTPPTFVAGQQQQIRDHSQDCLLQNQVQLVPLCPPGLAPHLWRLEQPLTFVCGHLRSKPTNSLILSPTWG